MNINRNIGNADRIIRIIAGLGIGVAGIYYQSWWGLIGLVPLITAFFRFCPLYCPIGLNTGCKKKYTAS